MLQFMQCGAHGAWLTTVYSTTIHWLCVEAVDCSLLRHILLRLKSLKEHLSSGHGYQVEVFIMLRYCIQQLKQHFLNTLNSPNIQVSY